MEEESVGVQLRPTTDQAPGYVYNAGDVPLTVQVRVRTPFEEPVDVGPKELVAVAGYEPEWLVQGAGPPVKLEPLGLVTCDATGCGAVSWKATEVRGEGDCQVEVWIDPTGRPLTFRVDLCRMGARPEQVMQMRWPPGPPRRGTVYLPVP